MKGNLRHLRVFMAVARQGSFTHAAELCHISQPAVTQAINKLERLAGLPLFQRTPGKIFPTPAGEVLMARVGRALGKLDQALRDVSPRLLVTATSAQLSALIAMREVENFTLAARRMGISQPSVHRAVSQLEQDAGRALFERTAHGLIATRPAEALAQAARLAFAELDQAEQELAELRGQEVGRIVIGGLPLSRSFILPRAIARFRDRRPRLDIKVLDGAYVDLLLGLRRGEVDFLVGALRPSLASVDLEQFPLFEEELVIVARADHPLFRRETPPDLAELARFSWVVAGRSTPSRSHFERFFAALGEGRPQSLVETASMVLMRELLLLTDHLGWISQLQIRSELRHGDLGILPIDLSSTRRPIGLTRRIGWVPTRAQSEFIEDLRATLDAPP